MTGSDDAFTRPSRAVPHRESLVSASLPAGLAASGTRPAAQAGNPCWAGPGDACRSSQHSGVQRENHDS